MGGRCKYLIGQLVGQYITTNICFSILSSHTSPYVWFWTFIWPCPSSSTASSADLPVCKPGISTPGSSMMNSSCTVLHMTLNLVLFMEWFLITHDWWKDCFDTLGFPLPFLDVNEVMDMIHDHFEQLVSHFSFMMNCYLCSFLVYGSKACSGSWGHRSSGRWTPQSDYCGEGLHATSLWVTGKDVRGENSDHCGSRINYVPTWGAHGWAGESALELPPVICSVAFVAPAILCMIMEMYVVLPNVIRSLYIWANYRWVLFFIHHDFMSSRLGIANNVHS